MGGLESSRTREEILYDLAILAEWPQEPETINRGVKEKTSLVSRVHSSTQLAVWSLIRNVGIPLRSASPCALPTDLVRLVNSRTPWQIAVSCDGRDVALLQDQGLEIRSARDEFTGVTGRGNVSRDQHPQWRQVVWSVDGTLIACSDSEGNVEVLDLVGTRVCYIRSMSVRNSNLPSDLSRAVAALVFIENKGDEGWNHELMVLTYQGSLHSYMVNSGESRYQHQHQYHFSSHYQQGINTAIYDHQRHLLIIGGTVTKTKQVAGMECRPTSASDEGLTLWRRLDISPYYKLVTPDNELSKADRVPGLWARLSRHVTGSGWSSGATDGIFKLCQSPGARLGGSTAPCGSIKSSGDAGSGSTEGGGEASGDVLVSIHLSGRLSLWSLPTLGLQRSWTQDEQPEANAVNPETTELAWNRRTPKEYSFVPNLIDVSWWSDMALILARCSGSVTISSLKTLKNLLGKSPEWFEPSPQVSLAHNGGFLCLECESKHVGLKRHLSLVDESEDNDEADYDRNYLQRCADYAKQAVYYVTDSERFQPPRKRPKLLMKTYRLICLKSTTPEELYTRKIDREEYGEALELAKAYRLDCDLVYQRQWRKTPVSIASIQDYLTKISKRSWVLHECIQPSHKDIQIDAMRELLVYGLKGTGLQALITVGNNQDGGRFILCDDDDDDDDEYVGMYVPYREIDEDITRKQELRRIKEEQLLKQVDFTRLTLEQREMCCARYKLLQYLDRLTTYEVMLGGPEAAESRFDYQFYEKFRSQNLVESAVEFARDGDWKSVDCLFTYHGDVTLPHRLAILSNFAETVSPREYRDLLPQVGVRVDNDEIEEWPCMRTRENDWCEMEKCRSAVEPTSLDFGSFIYQDNPEYSQFSGSRLTKSMLTDWYSYRAREIERYSRLTEHALELVHLGLERGVLGLGALYDDLVTMECLVYEGNMGDDVTFDELQTMTGVEKLQLLMSRSSEEMYDKDLRRWLVPYLDRCEAHCAGAYRLLLHDYLVSLARSDLRPCLRVFEQSKVHQRAPIVRSETDLLTLALDCIYACERTDAAVHASAIVECLPQRKPENSSSEYIRLHNGVDVLESHLSAAQCLEFHGLAKPLSYIKSTQGDGEETRNLMARLCRLKGVSKPPPVKSDWMKLMSDMLDLSTRVFTSLQPKICTEIFTEGLLTSADVESILLAGDMIESHKDGVDGAVTLPSVMRQPRVPYRRAVELVVSAAQVYFNSSAKLNDVCLELARACLGLITDTDPDVQVEMDLIESLRLLHEYGIQILPLKVRLCKDRLSLVAQALEARPNSYTESAKLLNLCALLHACGAGEHEQVGAVLRLVTQAALKFGDYRVAYRYCSTLMGRGYASIWPECQTLAENENFTDVSAKVSLLSFAVTHCTPDRIEPILRAKCLLETQILYEAISARMQPPCTGAQAQTTAQFSAYGVLSQAKTILSSTQRTTSLVLANLGLTLHDLPSDLGGGMKQHRLLSGNDTMTSQGVHAFYQSLILNGYQNSGPYDFDQVSDVPSISYMVLRKSQLEETVTEGQTRLDSTNVLLSLAQHTIARDTTLGLTYLLALDNATDAELCFDGLPRTALTLQLSAYYYALQVGIDIRKHGAPCPNPIYQQDPKTYIGDVIGTNVTSLSDNLVVLVEKLNRYNELMADFTQAQLLLGLGKGVDVERFTKDNEYKRETILGLTMTTEDNVFKIAESLSKKYELSDWEFYMSHLDYLFCDSRMTTRDVEDRVLRMGFVELLRQQPAQFADAMFTRVYPCVASSDHGRLLYYYQLLEGCQTNEPVLPDQHVRLLYKIKAALPGLDYKAFTSGKSDPLLVLEPLVNTTNVHVVAKLANKIPTVDGAYLHAGAVFACWAGKFFWHGDQSTKKTPETKADWIHRYENCGQLMGKMSPCDVVAFVGRVAFSDQSLTLTLDCRREIMKRALKFCRQQPNKRKTTEENSTVSWDGAAERLKLWSLHLDRLASETIVAMEMSEDDTIVTYGRLVHLSRGEGDNLLALYRRMYMDGQGPELVCDVLEVLPLEHQTANSLLQHTVQYIVQQIQNGANGTGDNCDPMTSLANLVRSVVVHQDNGGDMIGQDDVLTLLRTFCGDVTRPVQPRLDVLLILEKSFSLTDNDLNMLILYRTQAILTAVWPEIDVTFDDVSSDTAREALFGRTLARCAAAEQFRALKDLLVIWPELETRKDEMKSPTKHPWTIMFSAMGHSLGSEAGVEITDMARELESLGTQFSDQCIQYLFDELRSKFALCAVKLVLLFAGEAAYNKVAVLLKENIELNMDDELCKLILQRHLVPSIVYTIYYSDVIDYMLANEETNSFNVTEVARELDMTGHQIESGSLLLRHRGSHPALNTFSAALFAVTHWLHKS